MRYFLLVLLMTNLTLSAFGQVAPQTEKIGPITQASQQNRETWKKQQESLLEDSERKLRGLEGDESNEFMARPVYLPEPRISKDQKILITPASTELAAFADFLKIAKTGIFKILPNFCGDQRVVNLSREGCLQSNNDQLSAYSFRKKLYGAMDWADLQYQENKFAVGTKNLTVGLIAEINDVRMESLDKDSALVKSLIQLPMPKKFEEISARKKELEKGVETGEAIKFFAQAEVKLNGTYLLRSYAYRNRDAAANDKRIDIVVIFRVVGIDSRQGLTIIWKELYRESADQV